MQIKQDTSEMLNMQLEGYTYQEIGHYFGLSRQRIQQLLSPPRKVREFIHTKYSGKCFACGIRVGVSGHIHHLLLGKENYNDIDNLVLLCASCHRKAHTPEAIKVCPQCHKEYRGGNGYCSIECLKTHQLNNHIELRCSQCDGQFRPFNDKARIKHNQSGVFFCSKHCQGLYVAIHFGFGANPLQDKTCEGCGILFKTRKIAQKFCSGTCRIKWFGVTGGGRREHLEAAKC